MVNVAKKLQPEYYLTSLIKIIMSIRTKLQDRGSGRNENFLIMEIEYMFNYSFMTRNFM